MLRRIKCAIAGHDWNMMGLSLWSKTPIVSCMRCRAIPTIKQARKEWGKV